VTGSRPVATDADPGAPGSSSLERELPELPRNAEGPVFKAPWEAQAFAMALALHERGAFTWKEWAKTLAQVIAEVRQSGAEDTGEHYYRHWLTALERIATDKGLVTGSLLQTRKTQWADAARRTPHGKPIEL